MAVRDSGQADANPTAAQLDCGYTLSAVLRRQLVDAIELELQDYFRGTASEPLVERKGRSIALCALARLDIQQENNNKPVGYMPSLRL